MLRGATRGCVLNRLFLALNINKRFLLIWVTFSLIQNNRDIFIYENNWLNFSLMTYVLLETAQSVLDILVKLQARQIGCSVKLHKETKGKLLEKSLVGSKVSEKFQQSSLVSINIIRPPFPLKSSLEV